jgi:diaminohydroxyphosphoribosylaminopyrimidine deaminase / 5-amino-6-(5-phosphoribosylamino)uracil reductase
MHKHFLLSALAEASNGRGLCAPNPSVGAVAVKGNNIIAHAWHHAPGSLHAEPLVLSQFPAHTPDVTLYVTLEPCNHWGRTPPCVEAIIKHGIKRVVYAYQDPNPLVQKNSTSKILREHGVEVIHHPLAEIDLFYNSYAYWTRTKMPWVRAKLAQSLDGKIAGSEGKRVVLSNNLCSQFTHQQRQYSDIILTTATTIKQDNPLLNVRINDTIAAKPVAIVDRQLTLTTENVFTTAKYCNVYYDATLLPVAKSNCNYYPIKLIHGEMNLTAIIAHLGSLGYHDVWVEAGGKFFAALHRLGLVNQTHIYITPKILGEDATPAYPQGDIFKRQHSIEWQNMHDNIMMTLNWQND